MKSLQQSTFEEESQPTKMSEPDPAPTLQQPVKTLEQESQAAKPATRKRSSPAGTQQQPGPKPKSKRQKKPQDDGKVPEVQQQPASSSAPTSLKEKRVREADVNNNVESGKRVKTDSDHQPAASGEHVNENSVLDEKDVVPIQKPKKSQDECKARCARASRALVELMTNKIIDLPTPDPETFARVTLGQVEGCLHPG